MRFDRSHEMHSNSLLVSPNTGDKGAGQGCVPNNCDVICGRGKANATHAGNLIFNTVVRSSLETYKNAATRMAKSVVVTSIVNDLTEAGMRFLKLDSSCNQYVELSSDRIYDKVGHAIRDLIKLDKKGGSKLAAKSAVVTDEMHTMHASTKPDNAIPTNKPTSSIQSDSNIKTRACYGSPASPGSKIMLPDFRIKNSDIGLDKLIFSLGTAIEDDSEDLLAELKEDLYSMEHNDIWDKEGDNPLAVNSSTHFEREDVEMLEKILGLGQQC